jgi:transcriptional regulator with XRE-family HTH domain
MAKHLEYEEFSKRLREALRRNGVDAGSPTKLARDFGDFYKARVSSQAVRKWLHGEAIPSQDKLKVLAGWLGVAPEWLRFGTEAATQTAQQVPTAYRAVLSDQELVKRYHRLNHRQQQAVAEIIVSLAAKDRRG